MKKRAMLSWAFCLFATFAVYASPTQAAEQIFTTAPAADGTTGVTFQIGYTFGIHKGTVEQITGTLKTASTDAADVISSAHFSLPIASMRTGDPTRDCHMTEALGINYADGRATFPNQHVCDSNNQVPTSGLNAIVFPTIEFDLKNFTLSTGEALPAHLEAGKTYSVLVQGAWNIHGRTKDLTAARQTIPLQVTWMDPASRSIRIAGRFPILLSDFGVQVMAGGPLGVVKIKDVATVFLDLKMVPQN